MPICADPAGGGISPTEGASPSNGFSFGEEEVSPFGVVFGTVRDHHLVLAGRDDFIEMSVMALQDVLDVKLAGGWEEEWSWGFLQAAECNPGGEGVSRVILNGKTEAGGGRTGEFQLFGREQLGKAGNLDCWSAKGFHTEGPGAFCRTGELEGPLGVGSAGSEEKVVLEEADVCIGHGAIGGGKVKGKRACGFTGPWGCEGEEIEEVGCGNQAVDEADATLGRENPT